MPYDPKHDYKKLYHTESISWKRSRTGSLHALQACLTMHSPKTAFFAHHKLSENHRLLTPKTED